MLSVLILYTVVTTRCHDNLRPFIEKESLYTLSKTEAYDLVESEKLVCDNVAMSKITVQGKNVQVTQFFDWERPYSYLSIQGN